MKELFFFSNNKNKIKEVSTYFKNTEILISNLNNFNPVKSPKESGENFEDNAKIKAFYGYSLFKKTCFEDDSGICVEAKDWGPGVNSKKFYNKKNSIIEILNITKKNNNFKAYFKTSICLFFNKKNYVFFNGIVRGHITNKIKGAGGFAYDPIFIPDGYTKTFAEMTINEKNSMSHRAIAIKKLRAHMVKLI